MHSCNFRHAVLLGFIWYNFLRRAEAFHDHASAAYVPEPPPAIDCDRARSRVARSILNDYLFPYLEAKGVPMSPDCRLRPELDMLLPQEQLKVEKRRNQWRCAACSKLFREEAFIDKHLDNRHADLVPKNATACLAGYCDILHCDEVTYNRALAELHSRRRGTHEPLENLPCKPRDMAVRYQLCERMAHRCFPTEASEAVHKAQAFFLHQFCESHSCDPARRSALFPLGGRGGGAWQVVYYTLLAIVFLSLGGFYLYHYLQQRDMGNKGDLRRLAHDRRTARLQSLFGAKSKQY